MTTSINRVTINKGRALPIWFEITQTSSTTSIVDDTTSQVIEDDKIISRTVTETTGENVTLGVDIIFFTGEGFINLSYSSDNPSEININPEGNVVFQVEPEQTSSANITITATQGDVSVSRTVNITLTVSGSAIVDVIEGGVVGSARKALSDPLDNALNGANPSTQKSIFTTQDHDNSSYVRNTNFFLTSHVEALTCVSPWNSNSNNRKAGTAITKRHIILAAHYPYGVGTVVRFVASDNTVIERTVVQSSNVDLNYGTGVYAFDFYIALLDSDLPDSITPCKVFPSNYESFFPTINSDVDTGVTELPLLCLDKEENGLIHDLKSVNTFTGTPYYATAEPKLDDRRAFYENVILGDSGNPLFVVTSSELWLLTVWRSQTRGDSLAECISMINDRIVELDTLEGINTGYTVTEGDLSSYDTY